MITVAFSEISDKLRKTPQPQQSAHPMDQFIGKAIDLLPVVRENKVLSEVSELYNDILNTGSLIEQRKASEILINSILELADSEKDHYYDVILLRYVFKRIEKSYSLDLDLFFYIDLLDKIGHLLRNASEKDMHLSFENGANYLSQAYVDIFNYLPNKLTESIYLVRILSAYFVCLGREIQKSGQLYFRNLIKLLDEISSTFDCDFLQSVFSVTDNLIRDLFFKGKNIDYLTDFSNGLLDLFSRKPIASCKFYNFYSPLSWLLILFRRIQDGLYMNKEKFESPIGRYNILADAIELQLATNREMIDSDVLEDIKRGAEAIFDESDS